MSVLYRKYRPKNFAAVVGQNHIKVTLMNEIAQSSLAHAYLFVGPRGTGKTTLARLFARAINCEKRKKSDAEPCNECPSCLQIIADRSLDVVEIDAATHTQVDNVRDNIISSTRIPPIHAGGFKVFIIDEVHMLSKHAFNALLKTIEEPPERVVFILATTDVYKVPETIISRCQRFDFKKIPQQLIVKRLTEILTHEGVKVPDTVLASIARKSEGCMRDAESLLGQLMNLAEKGSITVELAEIVIPKSTWHEVEILMSHLQRRDIAAALEFVNKLTDEGMDIETFMLDSVEYIRQALLYRSIGPSYQPDLDETTAANLKKIASNFSPMELKLLLEIIMRETVRARTTMIPQLPLEMSCIEFCHAVSPSVLDVPTDAPAANAQQPATERAARGSKEMDTLRKGWSGIISQLKDVNHSLAIFLKVAHPLDFYDKVLTIGFKYDFHANTVRELKNKQAAEKVLGGILNQSITIDCVIDPNYTDNHKNFNGGGEKDVQDVLDIMGGGQVI